MTADSPAKPPKSRRSSARSSRNAPDTISLEIDPARLAAGGDPFNPEQRSVVMSRVRFSGTKPEMQVRKAVHAAGFRFRLHRKDLPGKPDLVFPRYRIVVFVHGCFWHWHGCKRSRLPQANQDYWEQKIARNHERDRSNEQALAELGWEVFVIWECQLEDDLHRLLERLAVS